MTTATQANRQLSQRRTIVQLVLVDETGDSYYRMRWPGAEMAEQNPAWTVINLDAAARERYEWGLEADLLVLIQSSDLDMLTVIEERGKRGKKTLIEYNDNFYSPQLWSPVSEPWSSPLLWQSYELIAKAGDALMVTGPGLSELFTNLGANEIVEMENHFPRRLPPFDLIYTPPQERLNIGWAGSLGHMADIIAIRDIIAEILEVHPEVDFAVMGNESLPSVLRLPESRMSYTPWGSMEDYIRFWAPIHIGIAPLLDTPYNRCRSDIKAVEIAASGALPVLSKAVPYQKFIDKTGVPSFSSPIDLKKVLTKLIRSKEKLPAATEKAYNYVRTERIGPEIRNRSQFYESLINGTEPSTYQFPVGPGYYEIMGTTETEPRSRKRLLDIQQLLRERKIDDAKRMLNGLADEHHHHPDIQLSHFKLLNSQDRAAAKALLPEMSGRFPRDLRFQLLILMGEPNGDFFHGLLSEVIATLSPLHERNRVLFLRDILSVLKRAHKERFLDISTLLEFETLYPSSPEIRLMAAELLEFNGRTEEARERYESLLKALESAKALDELRKEIQVGYLAAWEEGLKAR